MFKALLKIEFLRSKEATFWFVLFPILLTLLLTSIFGNLEKRIRFKIGVIGNSSVLDVFKDYFNIVKIEKIEQFIEKNLDIVVVLEENFDQKFQKALFLSKTKLFEPLEVDVYYIPGKLDSKIAKDVFISAFSKVNYLMGRDIPIKIIEKNKNIRYQEFLYGAILVMNIMSVVFFGYLTNISFYERRGVLKRLSVTPYNRFYLTFTMVAFLQILLSCVIFSIFDYFVYGVNIFNYNVWFYVLFGSMVFLSFGYMLSKMFKNPETTIVLGNIFFQVFMFVGGFYFNVDNVKFISTISKIIPSTYLVDGIRASYGYSIYNNHIFVPLAWFVLSVVISLVL
ncbi:ABC transporter [Thermosipho affectus]|uniref:ABC transporter n=1 Tax=Thermosipho affectus TaxID=660294 RepID=A0ABX3IK22_9BACT|nr:ABC transporter permease [Thermosipho affectus]ONN27745.1 ABC transporter [Thermosipho affectus]